MTKKGPIPTGKKVKPDLKLVDELPKQQEEVSPEMKAKIMASLREQELKSKGLKVAGKLSKEDYEYFKNLGMKEVQVAQQVGVLEVQKSQMIDALKQINADKGTFEKQLIEKHGLNPGAKYQVDTNSQDIIVQMTPEEIAETKKELAKQKPPQNVIDIPENIEHNGDNEETKGN